MASQIAFIVFGLLVIAAAWRVVTTDDVMRAALALVIVLGGLAPVFVLLAAEFIATVQVLVYVGAVVILFLFGIMLTKGPMEGLLKGGDRRRLPAFVATATLFGVLWLSIKDAVGSARLEPGRVETTQSLGQLLLKGHVFEFEVLSVLLLASLIGAVVLARRD